MKTFLIPAMAAAMLALPVAAQESTTTVPPETHMSPAPTQDPAALPPATADSSLAGMTADDLRGKEVLGPDGKAVGKVTDVVVGADTLVSRIVVDVGGFLGIGAKPVAITPAELHVEHGSDGTEPTLHIGATEEQLKDLPEYTG